jgi:hypothetical protein
VNVAHRPWWIVALLLFALAGAGAVAWHWLLDGGADGGVFARARRPSASRSDERPEPATSPAAAQREAEAPPSDDDPNAVHELAPDATVRYGIAVTVVRHEDGVPVNGAELVVLDAKNVDRRELADLVRDPTELRRRAKFRLRSDKQGLAQVPRPVASAFVVGLCEGHRGVLNVFASTFGALRLELWKPLEVAVRVVDGEGTRQPGIEVALAESERAFLEAPLRATTDEQGEAKITDVELDEALQTPARKFLVGLAFPNQPPVSAQVAVDPPPSEPVVLTLPAIGALAFHVVDENGDPLAVAGSLHLYSASTTEANDEASRRRVDRQALKLELDQNGRGKVPRVGLGLDFRAQATLPERTCPVQHFTGPAHAGETIDVPLPAGAIGPILTGNAVASDEAPLAGAELRAQLDVYEENGKLAGSDHATTTLESGGAFRLDFSRAGIKGREGKLFLRATREGAAPVEASVSAMLPTTGTSELGTLRLELPPRIASGIVVDDESLPIEGALVTIDAKIEPPLPFRTNHLPSATTGADGLFELRGETPDGSLTLRAQRGGYLPMKPLPFAAGASDLTVTLRMGGSLAGSVAMPDGFPNDVLFARVQLPGSWPMQADTQPIRGDGRFRFNLLPTGLWEFELLLGRDPDNSELLASFHQVAIHPFEQTRDPRLQELDLLAFARLVEATVRVPGGELAGKGSVARAASGRRGKSELSVPLKEGHALMPCVIVPVDLAIVVPGFLLQTARGVEGPIDVMMRRGIAVHVVVSGRNERQPDWIPVRVTAQPRDDALAAVWPGEPVGLDSGEASFVLPAPGRYRARIEFAAPPDPSGGQGAAAAAGPRRRNRIRSEVDFEVKDLDREQVIELPVKR